MCVKGGWGGWGCTSPLNDIFYESRTTSTIEKKLWLKEQNPFRKIFNAKPRSSAYAQMNHFEILLNSFLAF